MDQKKLDITSGNGLRLLSLDGGGTRALSQIKIVENLMERINVINEEEEEKNSVVLPCKCFDLIGGSDTGGVLAIMFGKLSMTVEEAYIEFNKIHQEVYAKNLSAEKRTNRLQICIEDLLRRRGLPIDLKLRGDGGCPCFVVATPKSSLQNKVKLRSYGARADFSTNVTVVEAVLATCAAQPIFNPVFIGSGIIRQELIGGTIGLANPAQELITEAQAKFDSKEKVSVILSIGTGHPGALAAPSSSTEQWAEILWRMVTNSEKIAQDMENRLGGEGIYFRFSVNQAFPNHHGTTHDPVLLNTFTQDYLENEEIADKLHRCVEALRLRLAIVGLEQLSGLRGSNIGRAADVHKLMEEEKENKILEGLKPAEMKPGPLPDECMEGTRQDILQEIENWVANIGTSNVLWVVGHPGVGKSAIASTVVNTLRSHKRLGASFFFQRAYASVSSAHALWRTVAFDLAGEYQSVKQHLVTKLEADPDMLTTGSIDDLFRQLIYEPLVASKNISTKRLPVVVIDALDECGGLDGQYSRHRKDVLRTLAKWLSLPKWFKLIVTSRSEQDIGRVLRNNSHVIEISAGPRVSVQSSEDIKAFLTARFQRITDEYTTLVPDWPGDQLIQQLTKRAGGLFIWARTVAEFIDRGEPEEQLDYILEGEDTVGDMGALYSQILQISFQDPTAKVMDAFHAILGAIIFLRRPLPATSVARLLSIEDTRMQHICNKLKAVVDMEDVLQINHQTFVDFLLDSKACPSAFCIQLEDEEQRLVIACLESMHHNLRFNICGLESSCFLNSEVDDMESRIDQNIPKYVLYSCRYWIEHLMANNCEPKVLDHLRYFTENQFLFWLEILSVTNQMNIAPNVLSLLKGWMRKQNQDESMVADMQGFTTAFASVIAQSAPHIYLSALPFAPRHSSVSKYYNDQYPGLIEVERGGLKEWPGFECIMYGHKNGVLSVAISQDGTRIVSGSDDMTMRMWDVATGQPLGAPFEGHTDSVTSAAFSPDGTRIVSGSGDSTVRVWDAATGQLLGTPFEGHTEFVTSVAFSPDGTRIVSSSGDKTVRVWDAATGQPLEPPFEGHTGPVNSVSFSPDGTHIVSGSDDMTVRVWDAVTGQQLGAPFEGHTQLVTSVAFSPDGTRIVSGSCDETVRVWDATTGQPRGAPFEGRPMEEPFEGLQLGLPFKGLLHGASFESYINWVTSVAFSPDGTRIVSSDHRTVRLWDAATGQMLGEPFEGHPDLVTSVAFFPDGTRIVSGSQDRTVRVWDATTRQLLGTHKGHTDSITSVVFSLDGTRIVSGSYDKTVRVWDVVTGQPLGTPFEGHTDRVTSVAFSPDGSRIASGSLDRTVRVWSVATSRPLGLPFEGHTDRVESVAFSRDGTQVVSGSWDKTMRVWDAATGQPLGAPFKPNTLRAYGVTLAAFSPDGTRIISSDNRTVRVWDATTGQLLGTPFDDRTSLATTVAFSPDMNRIISGFQDNTVQVWDAATGQLLGAPYKGHTDPAISFAFSPDRTRIVSGSVDRTLQVWDAATSQPLGAPFKGHTNQVVSVAFSPDGTCIASGSYDGTVRLWDTVIYDTQNTLSFSDGFKIAEGWVLNSNSERLFWVLPSLQAGLWLSGGGIILGTLTAKVNTERFQYGKSWTNCQRIALDV